tara:strand:- start:151 stop:543 length:393 start_codon:yes stop_codon:yes gene_type:complete
MKNTMSYSDVMQVYKQPMSVKYIPQIIVSLVFFAITLIATPVLAVSDEVPVMWVQVPQWTDDWAVCAVDIPDAACHWYVANADNTFGEGFDWENAPWFDINGLKDVAPVQKETVMEKLQVRGLYEQVVNN